MTQTLLTLLNIALFVAVIGGVVVYIRFRHGLRERVADRVRSINRVKLVAVSERADQDEAGVPRWHQRLAALGDRLPILNAAQRAALTQTLIRAGFRSRRATSLMVTLKFSAGIVIGLFVVAKASALMPVLGAHLLFKLLMMLGAFVVGMIVPEYALVLYARRRRRKIALCLPDALDLLVICTNAGNSLNVGIRRVASEVQLMCPPLADELNVTADELQLGGDSSTALRNFAERVDLPSARSLVSTLVQSQQFGTPITQALRVLSRIERQTAIMALEEKAAKLGPKMTLPMLFFILPVVALVAAGPAVLRLIHIFQHTS
ncbi:Type II/IV secretion system protein TadC, associated with Flp pilus assembly [Paraburkholderia sabiae]|uniref:type II secretion system F family protein n=1 Tax=Paraburkholderia sabiae TaxID=273251 RepID=UPI001CB47E73|nr:type II secretion system F family protein [Paraburkholderia sabiae]CAG9202850.1 Type II/IV secretion system protein TadC, associated with Flp pilus assembly [Paraburkholderia sabiae]